MSNEINKILACVDLSDYSLMVLEYSMILARQSKTQIIVFNVINQNGIGDSETPFGIFPNYVSKGMSKKEYIEKLKIDRIEKLKHFIEDNFSDQNSLIRIKIDTGSPFDCILNAIDKYNIDLAVMANKGRGNLSRVLFGSAAEKVFRHSPIPVLSVRERKRFNRAVINKNYRDV